MFTAEDSAIMAHYIVYKAIEEHGEEYVKDLAAKDPDYLNYRRGMN